MDIFLLILGLILMVTGFVGCFVPVLPGPPLSFGGLLLLQATRFGNFSTNFLITFGILTAVVTILDYFVPIWGTKKFGGSKSGVTGATVGLIIGLFMGPVGIILGPFLGAIAGELIAGRNSTEAFKSGMGSLIGFLVGTGLKLALTFVMIFYFFKEAIHNI
ncbi:MAG TPA: DUF456 domain-containing protein [Bacteroidales bacterium]|nr:DUF456 domain-containing protein [Bacteroidales bacterium]